MNIDMSQIITAEAKQAQAEAEAAKAARVQAIAYLSQTDWYVTRYLETGVAIPEEVTTARAAARACFD